MWKSITPEEFKKVLATQIDELSSGEREFFDAHRIEPELYWLFRRSPYDPAITSDDKVYVVWKWDDDVLYYDDVEDGFNATQVSPDRRIMHPRGNQFTLKEAIQWYYQVE